MTDNRTTELREKLDELGIEHLDSDLPNNKQTRWNKGAGGWGACYVEITHGSILPADSIIDNRTLRIYDCTPEQAIAATLGSGTLTAEQVSKATYAHSIHADCVDADWQAIADELNATIGEQPAKSGADALSRHARDMARNIQGNLGRCLYRRKDVAEMEEVSETLMELANELNADPGSGTCVLVETDSYSNPRDVIHVLECSECGKTCEHVNGSYPRCPHCGAKAASA